MLAPFFAQVSPQDISLEIKESIVIGNSCGAA